ncbi:hypothetical protein F383_12511 [Gossypium arboreum]|uniref:Uncharacterized protein n=1 Tax=Gossypium arboreum TaxID=29729 RepID=A0A0B0NFC8_GOSAR|nr:hypothetical protein F383_12511 [Gossypium arboreum]
MYAIMIMHVHWGGFDMMEEVFASSITVILAVKSQYLSGSSAAPL